MIAPRNRPGPLWGASRWRGVLETLLLAGLAWLVLLWLDYSTPAAYLNFFLPGTMFLIPALALYAALRVRLAGPEENQFLFLLPVGLALSAGLSGVILLLYAFTRQYIGYSSITSYIFDSVNLLLLLTASVGFFFLVLRGGVRLWLFWDRLRRQHLVWALTHAHLVLVLIISLVFAVFVALALNLADRAFASGPGLEGPFVQALAALISWALPLFTVLVIAMFFILAFVLPPSALFSYIVSRRTTRRLASLAAAADALRSGDYAVRVKVEGADEVARLQEGFNAMAAELQKAVRELRVERDNVAALSQQRREMVAGVSHDLRTPVATIRGYIESTLNTQNGALEPTLRHDLEVMEREVLRLQSQIDDLFTVARVDEGRLPMRIAAVDAGALVRRMVETAAPLVWRSSKVQVVVEAPPALPPASADAARLEQVIGNLLHNAIRHTSAGGLVGLVVSAPPGAVEIRVQDTGEGIAAEDLPHIWDRFYRAGGATTADGGSGLGLALVKDLTEAMGGSVAVESKLGEGSAFTVRLKRAPQLATREQGTGDRGQS